MNDLEEAKEMNKRHSIILLFYQANGGNKDDINEKELKKSQELYQRNEKFIKDKKLNNINKKFNLSKNNNH